MNLLELDKAVTDLLMSESLTQSTVMQRLQVARPQIEAGAVSDSLRALKREGKIIETNGYYAMPPRPNAPKAPR